MSVNDRAEIGTEECRLSSSRYGCTLNRERGAMFSVSVTLNLLISVREEVGLASSSEASHTHYRGDENSVPRQGISPLIYAEPDQQAVSVITLAADVFLQKTVSPQIQRFKRSASHSPLSLPDLKDGVSRGENDERGKVT